MRDLLILGDTAHAIEMAEMVARINRVSATWNLVGLVSLDGSHVGDTGAGVPILAFDDALRGQPKASLVPVYEWPGKDELPRERLISLVDPSTVVASSATIGLGCVIFPLCYVGAHAQLGDFLFCLAGTIINHDDIVEDHVTLTSGVVLAGDVRVESGCYLGQGCTVLELLTVGRGSLIGMGAVVRHDVPPNSVMVGNPAKRLRARDANRPVTRALRTARQLMRRAAAVLSRRAGRA